MGGTGRRRVVFSFYGRTQDDPKQGFRPTLALCSSKDWPVHRVELLHFEKTADQAKGLQQEISTACPKTQVQTHEIHGLRNIYDHQQAHEALKKFGLEYPWDEDAEEYFVHAVTGTEAIRAAWFLLVLFGEVPAKLVQAVPQQGKQGVVIHESDLRDLLAWVISRRPSPTSQPDALPALTTVSQNGRMQAILRQIDRAAVRVREPILLLGETGVGKTAIADAIRDAKARAGSLRHPKRFMTVNCATLRGDPKMVQATLFGQEKGAYTGAPFRRGLLERADGGMVFLDEVGTLDDGTQATLLVALETGRFTRVGGTEEVESEFALVAATNEPLERAVAQGRFRRDLYERLSSWPFEIPPLRDRLEDLPRFVQEFLGQWNERNKGRVVFGGKALKHFLDEGRTLDWPGNVRELQRSVWRMATLAQVKKGDDVVIDLVTVKDEIVERRRRQAAASLEVPGTSISSSDEAVLREHDLDPTAMNPMELHRAAYALRTARRCRGLTELGNALYGKPPNPASNARKLLQGIEKDGKGKPGVLIEQLFGGRSREQS